MLPDTKMHGYPYTPTMDVRMRVVEKIGAWWRHNVQKSPAKSISHSQRPTKPMQITEDDSTLQQWFDEAKTQIRDLVKVLDLDGHNQAKSMAHELRATIIGLTEAAMAEGDTGFSSGVLGSYAAEKLKPGTKVEVDCMKYTGEGCVTDQTHHGAHIMHFGEDYADKGGFWVAVKIPNGNTHFSPIDSVRPKREAA